MLVGCVVRLCFLVSLCEVGEVLDVQEGNRIFELLRWKCGDHNILH